MWSLSSGRRSDRSRWLIGATLVASTVAVGAFAADAAVVPNPVTDIRVTPTNPRVGAPILTEIEFCVPDATAAGDTFSVQLPPQFDQLPRGFDVDDPDGLLVADATVAGDPPIVTFTFTDYVDTRNDVCGRAFFESRLDDDVDVGGDETLTFVVDGGVEFDTVINPREPNVGINRDTARKGAFFADANDQCRTAAENCIGWFVESRPGPLSEVIVEDAQLENASFNCSTLTRRLRRIGADGRIVGTVSLDPANVTVTCSADSFRVAITDIPDNVIVRVTIRATPDTLEPEGGVEFGNTAIVTHTNVDDSVDVDDISSRRRSARAGGEAVGSSPPPTTAPPTTVPPTTAPPTTAPPTTTPATTTPPTTTPPTTAPPTTAPATTAPPTTVADTTTTTQVGQGAVTTTTIAPTTTNTVDIDQELPETGSGSSLRIVSFALITLIAGGVLVVAAARRRTLN